MADSEQERMKEALRRAQTPKRPGGLGGVVESFEEIDSEPDREDEGWKRQERVEHTSEKEHPPGKE